MPVSNSAAALTEWLGGGGAFGGAAIALYAARRQFRKDAEREEHDRDATDVASWTKLNSALDREIQRLHAEQDRMREDYERKLRQQREQHEREQAADRKRIGELEKDVESLQRLLRGEGNPPP
jgi:hypothetical protein